jgi:zinc transporter ZupT
VVTPSYATISFYRQVFFLTPREVIPWEHFLAAGSRVAMLYIVMRAFETESIFHGKKQSSHESKMLLL